MISLTDALDAIQVGHDAHSEDRHCPKGWHAVSNTSGNIAYFAHEADALAFRLMLVNMALNGTESAERHIYSGAPFMRQTERTR